MGYLENINWDSIKKDLQKGLEKGMAAVQKGAIVAKKKAGELTEEGKRQYRILTLKAKVHEAISDLGARVYALLRSAKTKNPALDARVKEILSNIRKLETQIAAAEKKKHAPGKKARKAA